MSGDERDDVAPEGDGSDETPAATPFDNPWFFPVVLWGFAAYFGFDVVTGAEAYQEYPIFNLGGFALLSVAAIYFTWSAVKEKREREDRTD